ncbi:carboxylesterase/lipase family protein [Streptomyces acidiscabies]|uniref:Carboxylic ester hydrolase n=1 Tax=Streptomyces acidiscabies TaxID=42234 RepID=A0AAP6B8V9_9ACTN|nr:carboxylesterase family protein [Streptomyces acidiscabies]MBP5936119.1 carboxylesterase family protein [Streptomyces sp. LBUM 1476]MBZ3915949.1 carboxylesterase/lipase family protein [Streptomyces acidiscabies]MDX2960342.1 carboxylesterase family protein [Streptomyces acidiscabies]MDX3023766.1 carboxylesterase family protein [Streptomyces acidiscabies]MDX3793987.1 carboxylesterase family protein [Streptomyces acidiscabies]
MRPVVRTPYGDVRGRYENGISVFRGIPYAAPPFGPRRFRPPVPPEPWTGVRDAGEFGPTAPKPPYSEAFAQFLSDPDISGDDCLNLNVWTPEPGPGARLPVVVWFHGGALTRGSSAVPVYDGTPFARDGIVFVSLNHRLGVEGYGLFPDTPANPGLRDQLAALEWVRDAIGAFGGDPDRVTLMGQSAGAISIGALIAAPQAQGLFRRAVLQSGAPEASDRDKVRRMVRRMANRLKIPATAEAFAAVDREVLLRTQYEVGRLSSPVLGGPAFGIVTDGDLVPRDPLQALIDGDVARDVDLLVGWTSDEYRLWLVPGGLVERVDRLGPVALAGAMARCHCGSEVPRGYRALHPDAGPAEIVGQMVTDHMLRRPLHRLADSRPGTSYLYEFAWPSGRPGLGACHSLELGFVFDAGDSPDSVKLAGENPPKTLAAEVHGAWTRFVKTGDPGWEAWDATHPVRVFGDGPTRTALGPRDADLALWDAEPAVPHQAEAVVEPLPARSLRGTELRSVVRRLRRTGSGKAG